MLNSRHPLLGEQLAMVYPGVDQLMVTRRQLVLNGTFQVGEGIGENQAAIFSSLGFQGGKGPLPVSISLEPRTNNPVGWAKRNLPTLQPLTVAGRPAPPAPPTALSRRS